MNTHVLEWSPLDKIKSNEPAVPAPRDEPLDWKPSRFNVQTTTAEGWLLVWNTMTGAMNAFRPQQHDMARDVLSQTGFKAPRGKFLGYLEERGYVVPADSDELRKVQYMFGQEHHRNDILELILLASEDCNFRCTYCYEDFKRGTMRPEVRTGVKNLVRERVKTLRTLNVSWFGGEPLYGMQAIEDLGPFFVEIAQEHGLQYFSHMTTNGYLLTEDVVDKLFKWQIADFQITIDGMPEDHDAHRGARDGSGTFDQIFENLENMSRRSEDFSVVIRINFDQENAPGLERFLNLLKERFGEDSRFTIAFHPIGKWGGPNDAELSTCGIGESQAVASRLRKAARTLGLSIVGDQRAGGGSGSEVCYAARPYNFVVGAEGHLMKCTIDLDKSDHNIVGKLSEDGKLNLKADNMALWTEPAFERDSGCQSCHMLPACQGVHCPKIRIDQQRAPCPPSKRVAKERIKEFFEINRGRLVTDYD